MTKLTKTFIDKVKPPAEGFAMHWNDSLKGYGLRVTAAGGRGDDHHTAAARVLAAPLRGL